jgi:hypothetical protein
MYICVYIELMTISISLVEVTMIDLQKNKKMMMMMMKDAFEDKRTVSSKFKSGETGKEERNRSMKFKRLFCAAL